MKVLILAAGEGRRIAPLSDNIPKSLIPLSSKNESCLTHTLKRLLFHGFNDIIVSLGYKYSMFKTFFTEEFIPNHPQAIITLVDARPYYINGPINSFFAAESYLLNEKSFLVIPSDTIFTDQIFQHLSLLLSINSNLTPLTCSFRLSRSIPPSQKFNYYVALDQTDNPQIQKVKSIHKVESTTTIDSHWDALIPILIIPATFFSYAKKRLSEGDKTVIQAIDAYIKEHYPLYNCRFNINQIPFYDMDTLSDYEEVKKYLKNEDA